MPDDLQSCPHCASPYGYASGPDTYTCPECGHDWQPASADGPGPESDTEALIVLDANGNRLADGDSVIIIKDLPVKGASGPLKMGTKVKHIRLSEGDHNIDCRIEGFGAMRLKSVFVRKA